MINESVLSGPFFCQSSKNLSHMVSFCTFGRDMFFQSPVLTYDSPFCVKYVCMSTVFPWSNHFNVNTELLPILDRHAFCNKKLLLESSF